MTAEPDFSAFVDFKDHDAVWIACDEMYGQGAVVVSATPCSDRGRDIVLIRGWRVSPYDHR
jgi:hypothetical protein